MIAGDPFNVGAVFHVFKMMYGAQFDNLDFHKVSKTRNRCFCSFWQFVLLDMIAFYYCASVGI